MLNPFYWVWEHLFNSVLLQEHFQVKQEACLGQMTYRAEGGRVRFRASRTEVKAMPVASGRTLALEMSAMPADLSASSTSKFVSFASREEPAACIKTVLFAVISPCFVARKSACSDLELGIHYRLACKY